MYCDAVTVAYRKVGINPDTGKAYKPWRYIPYTSDDAVFEAYQNVPPDNEALLLPCRKCMLCTGRYRRHWVLRCQHELHYHLRSCFLTLTVNDACIDDVFPRRCTKVCIGWDPLTLEEITDYEISPWHSLRHKPFQDFLKRLRMQWSRAGHDTPIRYYMCGEYGDRGHRPHYHAIMFGWWPDDARPLAINPKLSISLSLYKLWPYGFHTIAPVDPACVSYVAGYCDKKMDDSRMQWIDNDVAPEYVCMSRRPGLGGKFFDDFADSDLYPENDDGTFPRLYACLGKNGRVKMPKFYDDLLALRDPEKYARLVAFRQVTAAGADTDLRDWLNESHRRCAVAVARRRQREPGALTQVKPDLAVTYNG